MNYFQHESERLKFRKLTEEDVPSWIEFFENNNTLRFLGLDETKDHDVLAKEWVLKQIARYAENGLGHLAVMEKSSGQLIGFSGIIARELDGKPFFEIGYSFKPKVWGKGYATEAAKHIRKIGIETKIADQFVSIIHVENNASMQVAIKNGMTRLFDTTFMEMPVAVFGDM